MSDSSSRTTVCADCGAPTGDEGPRADCGSILKHIAVQISDVIVVGHDSVHMHAKEPARPSKKKLRLDSFNGWDASETG